MKKFLMVLVLVSVFMNSMVAMAYGANVEKTAKSTYFKAGILWDVDGKNDAVGTKNQDIHFDVKLPNLYDLLNLENMSFKRNFNLGFLNLTIIFLLSQEPIQ